VHCHTRETGTTIVWASGDDLDELRGFRGDIFAFKERLSNFLTIHRGKYEWIETSRHCTFDQYKEWCEQFMKLKTANPVVVDDLTAQNSSASTTRSFSNTSISSANSSQQSEPDFRRS
jgi:hypothetical protein